MGNRIKEKRGSKKKEMREKAWNFDLKRQEIWLSSEMRDLVIV
jgi:hypothetical protein